MQLQAMCCYYGGVRLMAAMTSYRGGKVKELMADGDDKEVMLANKAVDLLLYIGYILSWRHSQWMSKGRGRVWAITQ